MAAQVLRFMGCDVAALNTVQFSNHTGYGQFKGTRASAEEILTLYEGMKLNHLTGFDMMLSGYAPGAAAVNAVGAIARDLKSRATGTAHRLFWVLDPVMGDQGKLYVQEDVVPAYKALISDADLILPNQFELEVLTDTRIGNFADLNSALACLHGQYNVPHVVVTSVRLPSAGIDPRGSILSVVGSSRSSVGKPRAFRVNVPDIDCYFSGTGDMFAALLVARLREAVANTPELEFAPSWLPGDSTVPLDLPLCIAVRRVLASMSRILDATKQARDHEMAGMQVQQCLAQDKTIERVYSTKAAEIRVVRNSQWLLDPRLDFNATEL